MSSENEFYPDLTEYGAAEAQALIDSFKLVIKEIITKAVDDVMVDIYTDITQHIGSDSWTNYRNQIVNGFRGYGTRSAGSHLDFAELRKSIYKEHKERIDKDLNQDLLKEIEYLKRTIKIIENRY